MNFFKFPKKTSESSQAAGQELLKAIGVNKQPAKSILLGMQPSPSQFPPGSNNFKPNLPTPPQGTVYQLADIEKSATVDPVSQNQPDDKVNKVFLDIFKSVGNEKEESSLRKPANQNLSQLNNFIHSSPVIPSLPPVSVNPPLQSSSLPESLPAQKSQADFDGNSLLAKLAAGMKEIRHEDNNVQPPNPSSYPFPFPHNPHLQPNFRNVHPHHYPHSIPPPGQQHAPHTMGNRPPPEGFNPYLHQQPPRQLPPGYPQQPIYQPGNVHPHAQFMPSQKQHFMPPPGLGSPHFVSPVGAGGNTINPPPNNIPNHHPDGGLQRFFPHLQMGVVHPTNNDPVTYKSIEEIEKNFT